MKYHFSDLVDIQQLQKLMLPFYKLTGMPYAVLDAGGSILGSIGWHRLCDRFHRACPKSESNCRKSDSYISNHLLEGDFIGYKCMNGLMDYATPIIVEGQHLATLFTGQFLHEAPDEEYFRRQAREYGFDETSYLEELGRVPIIPKERAESIMVYFSQLAQFLASLGLEKKRQLEAADNAIKEQEERLKLVFEASYDGFWDWDVETGYIHYSPRYLEMLGYHREEIEPHIRSWEVLVHPDDTPAVMNLFSAHLAGQTARFESEYRLLTGSGDWKWVLDRGKVVKRDEKGKPLRMVGAILDISEIKQAEEALEAERRRLFSVLEKMPVAISLVDPGYSIVFANKNIRESIGELKGKICYEVYHGLNAPCEDCIMPEVLTTNTPREIERFVINGEIRHNYYYPFSDIDGSLLVMVLGFDVAEKKRLDKEIARLDRLNLVGEMAAGIGHEIRNPMTTVRGFLQMLGEKDGCARYKDYFDLMIEELDRANSIISEFLSLAKNKAVEFKKQNLNRIVKVIMPLISADALVADYSIEVDLNEIPELLLDEKEIRQLLLNLVRNGLEAMPPKGTLTIKTFSEGGEVILAVADQGKGIGPDVLEKIGTPFYTTKENGTGLGLAVCYSIAARHKASITVDTGPSGTTFSVRFNSIKEKTEPNKENRPLACRSSRV